MRHGEWGEIRSTFVEERVTRGVRQCLGPSVQQCGRVNYDECPKEERLLVRPHAGLTTP